MEGEAVRPAAGDEMRGVAVEPEQRRDVRVEQAAGALRDLLQRGVELERIDRAGDGRKTFGLSLSPPGVLVGMTERSLALLALARRTRDGASPRVVQLFREQAD